MATMPAIAPALMSRSFMFRGPFIYCEASQAGGQWASPVRGPDRHPPTRPYLVTTKGHGIRAIDAIHAVLAGLRWAELTALRRRRAPASRRWRV